MPFYYGCAIGLLSVIVYEVARHIAPVYFLHAAVYWVSWLIFGIGLYLLADRCLRLTPDISFKTLLRGLFIAYLIGNLIYYLYYHAIVEWVEPEILAIQEAQIRTRIEDYAFPSDTRSKVFGALLAYSQSAIAGFILSAGIAYTLRSNRAQGEMHN